MERVAFLIEDTHVRLGCLLNPEALVLRRIAGIHTRRSTNGLVTGVGLSDDPVVYTGGGRTELDLDLLFDVSLAGSSISTLDVRDLTRAFWELAENSQAEGIRLGDAYGQPPVVRFIWGKTWNIPGHVVAVAERLEYFTAEGTPRRSWLRMRMVRANEPGALRRGAARLPGGVLSLGDVVLPEGSLRVHQIIGGGSGTDSGLTLEAPSFGGSLLLAADIIGAALVNTNAARLLTAARDGIASAVRTLGAHIGSLFTAEGRIGRAVRSALDRISSTLTTAWSAAKEQTVRAFSAAAATIAGAAQRVWGALQGALTPLGAAIAAEVEGAVQGIRRGATMMGQAVATVARAVRAEAARVIASTAKGIDMAVGHVRLVIDRAVVATAELGQKLREALGPALDDIAGVLSAARMSGEIVTTAMARIISMRLQQVAAGAESLWSAGKTTLARGAAAAIKAMAQALHNIAAAREAMAAVHVRESSAVLQTALERTRESLAAIQGAPDEEQVDGLREDLASVRAAADVVELAAKPAKGTMPDEGVEPDAGPLWIDAWQALDMASEQLATPQAAQAVASIVAELGIIADAIPSVEQAQETAMMDTMKDAYSQADVTIPEAPVDDTIPMGELPPLMVRSEVTSRRVISGQRLDQLAYQYYGDAAFWRLLALFNDVDHPLHLPTGTVLRVPPSSVVRYTGDMRAENDDRAQMG